jgi:hypothetical protein
VDRLERDPNAKVEILEMSWLWPPVAEESGGLDLHRVLHTTLPVLLRQPRLRPMTTVHYGPDQRLCPSCYRLWYFQFQLGWTSYGFDPKPCLRCGEVRAGMYELRPT